MATITSKIPRLCPFPPEEKIRTLLDIKAANLFPSERKAKLKLDQKTQEAADSVLKTIGISKQPSKIPRPIEEIDLHGDLDFWWDESEFVRDFTNCGTKYEDSPKTRKLPAGYKPIEYGKDLWWDPLCQKPLKEEEENQRSPQKMTSLDANATLSKNDPRVNPSSPEKKEAFANDTVESTKQIDKDNQNKGCSKNKNSKEKGFSPNQKILLTTIFCIAAIGKIYFFSRETN